MAITNLDKMKIIKVIHNHGTNNISYSYFIKALGSKRYKDVEILDFLIEYLSNNLKSEFSKRSILKLLLSITLFLTMVKKKEKSVDSKYLIRLLDIKRRYLQIFLCVDLNDEIESEINFSFSNLESFIDKELNTIDNDVFVNEIMNLKDKIIELETKIQSMESSMINNEKYNSIIELVNYLNVKLKELEIESDNYKYINERLKKQYELLLNLYEKQCDELERLYSANFELLKEKEKIIEANDRRKKEEKLEEIIVNKLSSKKYTLSELLTELNRNNLVVKKSDLYRILMNLKNKINIINSSNISYPVKYEIASPNVTSNMSMNIDIIEDCYNLLVVSDYHLSDMNDEIIKKINSLYEYSVSNGIELILNLGDFLDPLYPCRGTMLNNISETNRLIESIIKDHPFDSSVHLALLGGNHDRITLKYGLDAIKRISEEREDFIYLGYDHASIYVNGGGAFNKQFMIHHPSNKFDDPVGDKEYLVKQLNCLLKDYYYNNNIRREDFYIDMIGHAHISHLNTSDNWCIVPSLTRDRHQEGAWHVKLYIKDGFIDNMVFIPLIFIDERMIAITEVGYRKVLAKKVIKK